MNIKKIYVIICIIICMCYIPIVTGSMNVGDHLDQQQTTFSGSCFGVENPCKLAQSFKPTVNVLTKISLFGCRNESAPNKLKISIRSVLDGQDIVSVIVDNSIIDLKYPDWFEVDFPNISVVPESTYFIVWTTTSGDVGEPFFWWGYGRVNLGDDLYTRGCQWLNCDGYLWYDIDFADFCFKTYGYSIPSVTINSPVDGSSVYGLVSIQGTAVDNDGLVQKVEIKMDNGSWMSATGTTIWDYDWDTSDVINGYHVIYARSFDGESYSDEVSIGVYVTNTELLIDDVVGGANIVSVDIQNIGGVDANNVHVTILIKGGFFNKINVEENQSTFVIKSGESISFNTNEDIFGLGKISITISAYANNADMVTKEVKGFIIGSFIIIL